MTGRVITIEGWKTVTSVRRITDNLQLKVIISVSLDCSTCAEEHC